MLYRMCTDLKEESGVNRGKISNFIRCVNIQKHIFKQTIYILKITIYLLHRSLIFHLALPTYCNSTPQIAR